jgi:hypothetical protein
MYTGSFKLAPEVERKLTAGDVVHFNFRPKNPHVNEEWKAVVTSPCNWARGGEISLDVFRPREELNLMLHAMRKRLLDHMSRRI